VIMVSGHCTQRLVRSAFSGDAHAHGCEDGLQRQLEVMHVTSLVKTTHSHPTQANHGYSCPRMREGWELSMYTTTVSEEGQIENVSTYKIQ
jgi:hypothetical protein